MNLFFQLRGTAGTEGETAQTGDQSEAADAAIELSRTYITA